MAKYKNSLNTLLEALSTSFSEDLEQVLDLWERMGLSEAQVQERYDSYRATDDNHQEHGGRGNKERSKDQEYLPNSFREDFLHEVRTGV